MRTYFAYSCRLVRSVIVERSKPKAFVGLCFSILAYLAVPARAQQTAVIAIDWSVQNRFRLFANEADFNRLAQAHFGKSVLEAERTLANATDGFGWAQTVGSLCFDPNTGSVPAFCTRDGVRENYLNPVSHRAVLKVRLTPEVNSAICVWTIASSTPETVQQSCGQSLERRFPSKAATTVSVVAQLPSGATLKASTNVDVRDVLIVGMGDSLASGEGNPHKQVTISEEGFCFRRLIDGSEIFFTPSRAVKGATRACPAAGVGPDELSAWEHGRAQWLFGPCHRSLYGYQARTALALAIADDHLAVTYLPLGCTGATIAQGLLSSQLARERRLPNGSQAPKYVEGQISRLQHYLQATVNHPPIRLPDVVLLTIGANDMGFSALVANVMVARQTERTALSLAGMMTTPEVAKGIISGTLKTDFQKLRQALAPLTGGSLDRVVFVPYGNPALSKNGSPCSSATQGFDIHPAFAIDGAELAKTAQLVDNDFVPALEQYAKCGSKGGCSDQSKQAMHYADSHRAQFTQHGFCATDPKGDPKFDTECFLSSGDSFQGAPAGLDQPLKCGSRVLDFRVYAPRQRWVRTANDSFFAAMTYPASLPTLLQAGDIHDSIWGVTSAVYGGAIHPTAEGHAAMADAALVEATKVLGFTAIQASK